MQFALDAPLTHSRALTRAFRTFKLSFAHTECNFRSTDGSSFASRLARRASTRHTVLPCAVLLRADLPCADLTLSCHLRASGTMPVFTCAISFPVAFLSQSALFCFSVAFLSQSASTCFRAHCSCTVCIKLLPCLFVFGFACFRVCLFCFLLIYSLLCKNKTNAPPAPTLNASCREGHRMRYITLSGCRLRAVACVCSPRQARRNSRARRPPPPRA